MSNNELLEALNILEQEKNISKDTLLEAIENSLVTACKNHFGSSDNVKVSIDPETCEFHVFQEKTVVETVEDPVEQISLVNAKMINSKYEIGDVVNIEVQSKEFGRIATQNAKNVILQKIREEERKVLYDQYYSMEKDVVTGVVQRYVGRNVSINLGRVDAILTENEQVKGEVFQPTERIKVYILEVKATSKGPKVLVSRTHPELVKRLFESEVAEVREGIVEIKAIAREAGSRTKIAVWSNDPDVDPVGACVGMNDDRKCIKSGKSYFCYRRCRRKICKSGCSGLSAFPCNRKRGTECKTCSTSDRIQDRYQERDTGERVWRFLRLRE